MEGRAPLSEPVDGGLSMHLLMISLFYLLMQTPAQAESVSLAIAGTSQVAQISCEKDGLSFIAPIPSPGNESFRGERAIAVIVENPGAEPQILSGRLVESARAAFTVEPTAAFLQALSSDQPVRISRLERGYVIPPQGAGHRVRSVAGPCSSRRQPANVVDAADGVTVINANLTLADDMRWIVLASRPTPSEALAAADEFRSKFSQIQVVRSTNGLFAIVAGPERIVAPQEHKDQLVRSGRAPADMFFSRGDRFTARVTAPR
jgi:hypothetical protein